MKSLNILHWSKLSLFIKVKLLCKTLKKYCIYKFTCVSVYNKIPKVVCKTICNKYICSYIFLMKPI